MFSEGIPLNNEYKFRTIIDKYTNYFLKKQNKRVL